jgi:hypothetical protein
MPYQLLYHRLPAVAIEQTRSIILAPVNKYRLPAGMYAFLEMFCDEPDCDCRRVFLRVVIEESPETVAVLFWGWGSKAYYRKWFGGNEININEEIIGPGLDPFNSQSLFSEKILEVFKDTLFKDAAYLQRVKKHYELFRQTLSTAQKGN